MTTEDLLKNNLVDLFFHPKEDDMFVLVNMEDHWKISRSGTEGTWRIDFAQEVSDCYDRMLAPFVSILHEVDQGLFKRGLSLKIAAYEDEGDRHKSPNVQQAILLASPRYESGVRFLNSIMQLHRIECRVATIA